MSVTEHHSKYSLPITGVAIFFRISAFAWLFALLYTSFPTTWQRDVMLTSLTSLHPNTIHTVERDTSRSMLGYVNTR